MIQLNEKEEALVRILSRAQRVLFIYDYPKENYMDIMSWFEHRIPKRVLLNYLVLTDEKHAEKLPRGEVFQWCNKGEIYPGVKNE